MTVFAPFPVSKYSSIKKLTCCGIDSQHIPNIPHLRGVRKYSGPGCSGLLGKFTYQV